MAKKVETEIWESLLKEAMLAIGGSKQWHWFKYHFAQLPPHPLAQSMIDASAYCEKCIPGLGFTFIKDFAKICGKKKHEPHYDQLLQKLSELLVLSQLLSLKWPIGTKFQHEPAVSAQGKRPELRIATPERNFLFEVKAPSLLEHIRARNTNTFQVPGRVLDKARVEGAFGADVTLPRDNPIKDFLLDANKKFAQFKKQGDETSILIIVWDDFIYEPITVLTHEQCGLLTPNSYFTDDKGAPVQFEYIDAVVIIRHLTYLYRATRDEPLDERAHALDFGNEHSLPNLIIPITDPHLIPSIINEGLRTASLAAVQHAADYRPKDFVIWL